MMTKDLRTHMTPEILNHRTLNLIRIRPEVTAEVDDLQIEEIVTHGILQGEDIVLGITIGLVIFCMLSI